MPSFGATPPTSAVSSTVATASIAAPASSAAPSSRAGLFTGFGMSSAAASLGTTTAAASYTGFSSLTQGSTPASSSQAQPSTTLSAFGMPLTTSAVSSTVAKASMAAPASSAAPSGTWGFGVSSAAASVGNTAAAAAASSYTGFSSLTKGSSPASSSQAQPSTTVPAFGVTTSAPVAAMTTTQTSTSLVEASTSGSVTSSTVSTTISTAPKLPSKTLEEAPLTSFKLAAEVQTSTPISPVQPSSLDFDALDLETQLALICGGSSSSGLAPSVKAEQAICRIKLWQAKDFAVEEGHQSVGELINNLQILAEENLISKSIFSSGVTSAQEFQQAADLWGTIHTSFEQAITSRNVYQRSAENLEKDRSQCFAQDFELQYLKNEALEVEAEIAKLQTQLKAIKTKEKEVRIKLQRNLRDTWELQKQITTAQPGLEESHALILRGSKLRADMDAKFRVLKVILTSIVTLMIE
ncbi:PREDICTED: cell wall protein TIR4-like [Prunus mume]|uniref:Cell wall protein TIR4-like n=1 Tax=Prunus mume TaxID=102107 RepID=A0ABM0P0H1_PRUMU|nr:PREDICTED: cell wall protein TIR4-like [Prunus mume]